ncbi:hypothetical protein PsorP6_015670 [Peronosclerospora sorghi]|uniref:Uncharacterized protein n=1 Tax=Peronosclerospora sorghi TaxID=230839 RepID=A0ACC0WML7_9STRA|nr:hypothetical protein PsorP6_015670 [Peronosclerospora sorghi]
MYAGADKYGGSVAGKGHPDEQTSSRSIARATGISLEDAIETATAEETVVVDVPYSYVQDEADPTSVVTGVSHVLLNAQLNPEAGGLMWVEHTEPQEAYKNVIAMSQMTSMLRDKDRNQCYERGIQQAIATFIGERGYAPLVLDIGTGTGLLAMFAATHGAAHVYACEMFVPMAEIAQQVTAANQFENITVFKLRSTDLTVRPEHDNDRDATVTYHLPRRADMLVSELFDSILLGEAVVPTIRHARQHLLTPDARIVPARATVFAQIMESDPIHRFNSFHEARHHVGEDATATAREVELARSTSAYDCTGSKPALPLQFQAIASESRALTTPTTVLSFDFTQPMTETNAYKETIVDVIETGTVQAVLMWWEVAFDHEHAIVYSTKPGAQAWQDHWVQVVFPLHENLQVMPNERLVVRAYHDELRIWFDVERCPVTRPVKHATHAIAVEKPPCTCGMHLVCNAERIAMLTDPTRRHSYRAAVASAIAELAHHEPRRPLSCLDISDGSLLALLAAQHEQVTSVTSIESKQVSARIFEQLLRYNTVHVDVLCSGVKGLLREHLQGHPTHVDLLVGEPFYYSMQNLPVWQAFNFWLRRSAVQGLLHPKTHVIPARARILAQAVQFEHLHECFGAVGTVSGYDHSAFDRFQDEYCTRNFPFPVYMYPYAPSSDVVELARLDFMRTAHSLATHTRLVLSTGNANAVIIWLEYVLDPHGHHVVVTGPRVRHAKQWIRFLPPRSVAEAATTRDLVASLAFDSLDGSLELRVDVVPPV